MRFGLVRVTKARPPEGVLSHHMVACGLASFKKDTEKKFQTVGKLHRKFFFSRKVNMTHLLTFCQKCSVICMYFSQDPNAFVCSMILNSRLF